MTVLHMETESVRAMAAQIRQAAEAIRSQAQTLNSSAQVIDWLGPSRDEFVMEVEALLRLVESQVEAGVILSARMNTEVDEWEQITAVLGVANSSSSDPISSIESGSDLNSPVNQFLQSNRSMSDIEKLLKTLYATKPLVIEEAINKIGLGWINDIKDVIDLMQTGDHWQEINQATKSWEDAVKSFGATSPQASAAYEVYNKAWMDFPVIGKYIEVALNMGKANPVY